MISDRCSVCAHPRRQEIEARLASEPIKKVLARFPTLELAYHLSVCMGGQDWPQRNASRECSDRFPQCLNYSDWIINYPDTLCDNAKTHKRNRVHVRLGVTRFRRRVRSDTEYNPKQALDNKVVPGVKMELAHAGGKDSSTGYQRFHHSTKCNGWVRRLSEPEWKVLVGSVITLFTPAELEEIVYGGAEPTRLELKDPNPAQEASIFDDHLTTRPKRVQSKVKPKEELHGRATNPDYYKYNAIKRKYRIYYKFPEFFTYGRPAVKLDYKELKPYVCEPEREASGYVVGKVWRKYTALFCREYPGWFEPAKVQCWVVVSGELRDCWLDLPTAQRLERAGVVCMVPWTLQKPFHPKKILPPAGCIYIYPSKGSLPPTGAVYRGGRCVERDRFAKRFRCRAEDLPRLFTQIFHDHHETYSSRNSRSQKAFACPYCGNSVRYDEKLALICDGCSAFFGHDQALDRSEFIDSDMDAEPDEMEEESTGIVLGDYNVGASILDAEYQPDDRSTIGPERSPIDKKNPGYAVEVLKWGGSAAKRMQRIREWERKQHKIQKRQARSKHDLNIFHVIHDSIRSLYVPPGHDIVMALLLRRNVNILKNQFKERYGPIDDRTLRDGISRYVTVYLRPSRQDNDMPHCGWPAGRDHNAGETEWSIWSLLVQNQLEALHPTWREFVGRQVLGDDREEQLAYVAQWEKSRRRLRLGG